MSDLPNSLKYAATHEWAKLENGNVVRVGITDFAQQELGDLVYVELPEVGRQVKAKEQCAVVESVKTASDLYSPVTGEIVEVNESLSDSPEQINDTPYETWIFCVKTAEASELNNLMDADAYQAMIEAE
ncbi:glycine cleavage system protein GcvH [Candidatus Methylomicrobium oryzae]|jgi:glycine cleavage system H protein|uniref:glycine cleavage system protein GcvH n=1 Tax=Candidatus Methylomicrobium oryzae TaxID=2802053 RepID=UPI001924394F|nr:glycine cleavage system protein GcvH [Methylomicrobium sp. RS1]MBL1262301.1 glycine cleavage system protein GcvH [Methylomicrobium sp. RS1]